MYDGYRGFVARGEDHGSAKLKCGDQAAAIRTMYAAGVTQKVLADRFGIGQPAVSKIVTHKTWKHVN